MEHNKIIRGTYGKLWVDEDLLGNIKKFEAKLALNYEEIAINGELGTYQRYTGHAISGTMLLHKIDSKMLNKVAVGANSGSMPEFKIVARLADPDSEGAERIELLNVTFDEVALMQFENKKVLEESIPFKAANFRTLDLIV